MQTVLPETNAFRIPFPHESPGKHVERDFLPAFVMIRNDTGTAYIVNCQISRQVAGSNFVFKRSVHETCVAEHVDSFDLEAVAGRNDPADKEPACHGPGGQYGRGR